MAGNEDTARSRAKRLVKQIGHQHGHLSGETLSQIHDPTVRASVIEALKAKDDMIGSTVIT